MAWFIRIDRFADAHLCFSQEASDSCGLASTKRIVFKVNKLRVGAEAVTTESRVENVYKRYDSTAVNVGSEGVFFNLMDRVLNDLGIGHWTYLSPGLNQVAAEIIARIANGPVLLDINWNNGARHSVVWDAVHKVPGLGTYAAICDPADGNVHITRLNPGSVLQYSGKPAMGVEFWGKADHNYSSTSTLRGNIERLVYCDTLPT